MHKDKKPNSCYQGLKEKENEELLLNGYCFSYERWKESWKLVAQPCECV